MHPARLLPAALVCLATTLAAAEGKLPSSVERAVERFEKEAAEIRAEAEEEIADEREDLLDDLEKEMERATRRGDLDGALAIRNLMNSLREQAAAVEGGGDSANLLAAAGGGERPKIEPEELQDLGGGVRLLYYSSEQRDELLASLPPAHESLARKGKASGTNAYQGRVPQRALEGKRSGNHWTVTNQPGTFKVVFDPPISPRLLVFINRHEGGGDMPWGAAELSINGKAAATLAHDFDQGDILVVDLGQPRGVSEVEVELAKGGYAGLAGFEAH